MAGPAERPQGSVPGRSVLQPPPCLRASPQQLLGRALPQGQLLQLLKAAQGSGRVAIGGGWQVQAAQRLKAAHVYQAVWGRIIAQVCLDGKGRGGAKDLLAGMPGRQVEERVVCRRCRRRRDTGRARSWGTAAAGARLQLLPPESPRRPEPPTAGLTHRLQLRRQQRQHVSHAQPAADAVQPETAGGRASQSQHATQGLLILRAAYPRLELLQVEAQRAMQYDAGVECRTPALADKWESAGAGQAGTAAAAGGCSPLWALSSAA